MNKVTGRGGQVVGVNVDESGSALGAREVVPARRTRQVEIGVGLESERLLFERVSEIGLGESCSTEANRVDRTGELFQNEDIPLFAVSVSSRNVSRDFLNEVLPDFERGEKRRLKLVIESVEDLKEFNTKLMTRNRDFPWRVVINAKVTAGSYPEYRAEVEKFERVLNCKPERPIVYVDLVLQVESLNDFLSMDLDIAGGRNVNICELSVGTKGDCLRARDCSVFGDSLDKMRNLQVLNISNVSLAPLGRLVVPETVNDFRMGDVRGRVIFGGYSECGVVAVGVIGEGIVLEVPAGVVDLATGDIYGEVRFGAGRPLTEVITAGGVQRGGRLFVPKSVTHLLVESIKGVVVLMIKNSLECFELGEEIFEGEDLEEELTLIDDKAYGRLPGVLVE